jgi:hypothetical protein
MKCFLVLLAACGHDASVSPDATAPSPDAAVSPDATFVAAPAACAGSGSGAVTLGDGTCVVFLPTTTGALATGDNAMNNEYALAPTAASSHLVLFLNPSLGSPATSIADPATNVYTAGVAAGDYVLAISYSSDQVLGISCADNDPCYIDSRMAVLTGAPVDGAAQSLASIDWTTGIYGRTILALRYLVASQPGAGWDQFIDTTADPMSPAAVHWDKVISVGHSQGGGHAELIGREQAVARIVTLSSPCDEVNSAPASWLHPDASWKTDVATLGYGFSTKTTFTNNTASGDTICTAHAEIWNALGYAAAHKFDDATQCAGVSGHTATIQCTANMARVQTLLDLNE